MSVTNSQFELLTVEDLSQAFGKCPDTIRRWVKAGSIPKPIRPGGPNSTPYWRRVDFEAYMAAGGIHAYRRLQRSP